MKRLLFGLALISLAVLTGCNRSSPGPITESKDTTNAPSSTTGEATGADAATNSPIVFAADTRKGIASEDVPLLEQIDRENTRVVASATPCIVRITASRMVDPHAKLFGNLPFKLHFGPGAPHMVEQNEPSYGSGVIISKDGYIVTNAHVLEDSTSVEVQLQDQRIFPAKMIASDAPVDVAVLKIEATGLSVLPWGNSDEVAVGEQVFAIGNPFNLDDSVSKGIVSAKGRNLPDSNNYEDFIQTDAAINPGNSGGALINIHGELIGMDTAIASMSRGNEGVGLAIPSNLVRFAVEGLLKEGRLVRGYLGVRLPTSIDEGVTAQLGLDTDRGALLAGVQPSSPADAAKLHSVDFITEVDGHRIESVAQLRLIVAQIPVGKEVPLSFIRAGETHATTVKIAELPKEGDREATEPPPTTAADDPGVTMVSQTTPASDNVLSGVQVTDLNEKSRQKFGVEDVVTSGVVVTGVQEGSLADTKGLIRGDVIELACAHRAAIEPLTKAADFTSLSRQVKSDQSVVLLVHHGKSSGFADKSSFFALLEPPGK